MSRKLYPYQERVYQALMAGKNVIIQAPTGAGKTFAALYPYFENLAKEEPSAEKPLPPTCRYAVPMRVLATQFQREFEDHFSKLDTSQGTEYMRRYHETLGLHVPAIQTGETPDDPQFESPLTFCTIDQLLASFIGTPYSVGHARANLNVGAVAGSYLVLDEFHLFPLEKSGSGARATTLAMLQLLKGYCRFALMTATFSTHLLRELGDLLDAEVVQINDEEGDKEEIATIMHGRSRTIQRSGLSMTPEAILEAHQQTHDRGAGASLVVCNTVARAQDVYVRLRDEIERRGQRSSYELHLLHSRFTKADRQEKSKRLEDLLGEHQWDSNGHFKRPDTIIVATQVVEVGLNISAGVLHTELAPANSIIQRAGRCARFKQQQGEVIVYPIPPKDGSEKISYKPYDDKLCETTWEYLGDQIARAGAAPLAFGFNEEQALIDAVHTSEDQAMIAEFHQHGGQIAGSVLDVLTTHERGREGELIRDVSQVQVVIHSDPDHAITTDPFQWESFGLHPGTLAGAWESLEKRHEALGFGAPGWVMQELIFVSDATDREEDNDRKPTYQWQIFNGGDKLVTRLAGTLRVALPPELATYDSELGFRLLTEPEAQTTKWQSQSMGEKKGNSPTSFEGHQASYVAHISGLIRAYRLSVHDEIAWVAARLESDLGMPADSVDRAIRLAIACHDIGKLSKGWQVWAHAWQQALGSGYAVKAGNHWLAKTDRLNYQQEKALKERVPRLKNHPNHACEGAHASAGLIARRLSQGLTGEQLGTMLNLWQAVLSAIARHHTPTADSHQAAAWSDDAREAIVAALTACDLTTDLDGLDLSAIDAGKLPDNWLIIPNADSLATRATTWLGFVIVRALRLCDQRAERV